MAVEYDKWTDARAINEETAAELKEIIGDKFEVCYDTYSEAIAIKEDEENKLHISDHREYTYLWINNSRTQWTVLAPTSIKYYAKRSGEILIASTSEKEACAQVAIGPCSDGSWGMVAVGKPSSSNAFDTLFLFGKNMPPYPMTHNITNNGMPNKMFLSLRNVVLREDITFDNIYVNNYGYTDPFTTIEMNGERYASANGTTGNNVCLIMKL